MPRNRFAQTFRRRERPPLVRAPQFLRALHRRPPFSASPPFAVEQSYRDRRGCVKSHTPLERMTMNQKLSAIVATCGLFFTAGAIATAAAPWRVFASGSDSGDYSTFASANADVIAPKALAVRTTHTADVSWSIICSGKTTAAAAGTVVVADVALAQTCTLDGSAITHSGGKVTVQLLRR